MLSAMAAEILRNNHSTDDMDKLAAAVERTDRRHAKWDAAKERKKTTGRGNKDTKLEAHIERMKYGKLGAASPVRKVPIAKNSAPE